MKILMICKYPPIQGGVSAECYWTAQLLSKMGHHVCVLTNAEEVEGEYRMNMTNKDRQLLTGFFTSDSVKVISTNSDRKHVFVPQVNPSVSKLLSRGLEVLESERPDIIWAHYLEPYGVVAYLLSEISGIPYIFRHAGSDIGRLMLTSGLQMIHRQVLRNATFIMTRQSHHDRFLDLDVPKERLVDSFSTKLRSELFFPTPCTIQDPVVLGVYGKTGETKGTGVLLDALAILKRDGLNIKLKAHWGGKDLSRYLYQIRELGLEDMVEVNDFIPHWHIPDFIRSCDAILFLENRFKITFHQPSIPLEVVSCGRPVITTSEVASKPLYDKLLVDGENAFIVEKEVGKDAVVETIKRAVSVLATREEIMPVSTFAIPETQIRVRLHRFLEQIQITIKERR
ncbi:MAG: glycosyltransferase [Candidatus Paceibacterota bacterium]